MAEFIQHEPDDETAWICLCGNTPDSDGFTQCDRNGATVEPMEQSDWSGLYRCERCLRIIDQSDRMVVGAAPQLYRFHWQGIEIEARYWPLKWRTVADLEVESITPAAAPLPITETGYRSHFHKPGTVEARGGDVVEQVIAWLDEEAASASWLRYVEASRQGELF